MSHCSNCRTPMNDQMIYCSVCGQKNRSSQSRSVKKSWFIGLVIVMLCIGGGTFGYFKYQAAQPLFKTSQLTHAAADIDQVLPEGASATQLNQLADEDLEDYLIFDAASPDSLYEFLNSYAQRLPLLNNGEDGGWDYYDSTIEDYSSYADLFYGEDDLSEDERDRFGDRLKVSEEDPYSYLTLKDMTFDRMEAISESEFRVETTETYARVHFSNDEEKKRLYRAIVEYEVTFDDDRYSITSVKRTFKKEMTS